MRLTFITEGKTEQKIYRNWISHLIPSYEYKDAFSDLTENSFKIFNGGGYPNYLEIIADTINEIRDTDSCDRLIVCADSEENEVADKIQELNAYIENLNPTCEYKIVIQHRCIESWALGNRRIISTNPTNLELIKLKRHYDVRAENPEELPTYSGWGLNRAQLAVKYLTLAINDKRRGATYDKGNPTYLYHHTYFDQLKSRMEDTGHIASFQSFLDSLSGC